MIDENKLSTLLTAVPVIGSVVENASVNLLKSQVNSNQNNETQSSAAKINQFLDLSSQAIFLKEASQARKILTSLGAICLLPLPAGIAVTLWQMSSFSNDLEKISKIQKIRRELLSGENGVADEPTLPSDEEPDWVKVDPEWIEVDHQ